ncbi:MAG: hypothetical protein KA717_26765 [Woronichinia naegeliana WA131]|uniref:Uncharacterized protein n=1 Tax=Woronichinia naegeliana WA131 TaxID=2824559 RepID=A0A977KUY1_9CYAN|nr:MAG: hypothetical protein KA717_26765 [Woronichinia naegeliana WA131]
MGKDNKGDREDEKMQGIISMAGLIAYVVASIEKMKDPRQPRVIASYLLQKIQTKREKYSVKKKQSSKRRKGYYLKKVSE